MSEREEEYIPEIYFGMAYEHRHGKTYQMIKVGFVPGNKNAFLRIPYFVYSRAEQEFNRVIRETVQATLKTFVVDA